MEVAPDRSTNDTWLVAGLLLVLAAVAGAFGALARWQGEAGAVGAVPERWPAGSSLSRSAGRATVLLFVSAGCPCSRASLHELAAITSGHDVDAVIVVSGSGDAIAGASRIPHARVVVDATNREARRFGALTSGQALVYSPDGRRLYAGGITLARGHEGDNSGERAVIAALRGVAANEEAPVFGCAIPSQERVW